MSDFVSATYLGVCMCAYSIIIVDIIFIIFIYLCIYLSTIYLFFYFFIHLFIFRVRGTALQLPSEARFVDGRAIWLAVGRPVAGCGPALWLSRCCGDHRGKEPDSGLGDSVWISIG